MDLNKSLQNYYFSIQMDDFKISIVNTKPCPRLKPGSKSQKMILQRPFNFEKYESTMSIIEKIDVKLKSSNAESIYNPQSAHKGNILIIIINNLSKKGLTNYILDFRN